MNRVSSASQTVIMVAILAIAGWASAETPAGSDKSMSQSKSIPSNALEGQATDMIDRQGSIGSKYDVVPVRRGELKDEKGGALDQVVKNKKGETLGTIEKLLKDSKTGKTEYAVLELKDTKEQLPLQWSQFKQEQGKLTLNAAKKDLYPVASSTYSKDLSPEVSQYMDEINELRNQPKPKGGQTDQNTGGPAATGPMGESSVGGGGPSGTNPLPSGQAPGYEGGHPSSKR
ncbi:hypothetical protein YTPLAS72_01030 [Nitrospira sp.]|nr:hypothetical protein YTPLAS72_01030 [Nitrospira sp.]